MEQVLAVETNIILPMLQGTGFITEGLPDILNCISRHGVFIPRDQAECTPAYKQMIPYAVISRGSEFFLLQRTKNGSEKRLHNCYTLGVGGHINLESDGAEQDPVTHGLLRELEEEVSFSHPFEQTLCGIIHDDSNAVGNVHLGIYYRIETAGEVTVRETDKLSGTWVSREKLSLYEKQMESWSTLLLPVL